MRKITLLVLFCCTHLMMLAQTKSTNTNEAPTRVKCYTTEYMAELRRNNPKMQTEEQFEQFMAAAIAKRKSDIARGVVQPLAGPYVITVIVHVLHTGQPIGTYPNLSQRQVASQIRVLNEDFNRTNVDRFNAPVAFQNVGAGMTGGITFQLARRDPAGNLLAEAGVHRQLIAAQPTYTMSYIDATIKPATMSAAWDNGSYLNMWTIPNPVSDPPGSVGLYGYAQFPNSSGLVGIGSNNGTANTDGLVMAATAFGSNYTAGGVLLPPADRFPNLPSPSDKGRTATHELGHGLGLKHIWGSGTCGDDNCADTPTSQSPNYNACFNNTTPGQFHPKANTCGTGTPDEMFENFMDYVDDRCMNMFTADQVLRMVTVMDVSPGRSTLTAASATVGSCPVGAIGLTRAAGAYPAAGVGQSYTQTNVGTGAGTPNAATGAGYVYAITLGTLPAGLTLNTATGVISGVASTVGTSNFSITPSGAAGVDAAGNSTACLGNAVAYSIQVVPSSCPAITILPATGALPNAAPGVAYTQSVTASGATAPYTYTISSGTLPAGFTLSSAGVISGTSASPQVAASFTVLATDATTPAACQALINYTLAVVAPVCVPTAVISTYPYLENFESVTAATAPFSIPAPTGIGFLTNTNMPCGWKVYNANGDARSIDTYVAATAIPQATANSGTKAMMYLYSNAAGVAGNADDWVFSPGFNMNAGQTYNISLQYRVGNDANATYPEKFEVRWGTSQTVAGMPITNQLFTTPLAGATNITYAATTPMSITPTTTGPIYIGIFVNSVRDQYFLNIDDFSITTTPVCATTTVSSAPTASALSYTVGTAISDITMSATGVAGTYTYSITSGALPAGVTMTTAGVISGTPTTAATSGTFTVTATNGTCTGTKVFTYGVACPTLTVDSTLPASALTLVVNTPMPSITMSTTGAAGTFVYTITAGALPTGVTMSAGVISGNPSVLTASGTFTVTSTYGTNCTATKVFTYNVVACPVNFTPITGSALPAGTLNVNYSTPISQSGISGTVTFSQTGLPTGLGINPTSGGITGTPAVGGTFTVVVSAANTPLTCSASATYTLVIACPTVTLTIPTTANNGNVGIAYSATVTVPSGSTATGFTATGLPAGFAISSTGVITGTASATSSSLVSITATLNNGCTATGSYTLSITCPTITFTPVAGALAPGTVGTAYSASVAPSIGTVTATGLPGGLSMTTAGVISGIPNATGSFTVIVSAVIGSCPIVTSNYTIVTACPTTTITPATGATLIAGVIGTAYTATITSNLSGATFTATGLPAGLSISSAGVISGTPTAVVSTANNVAVTATLGTCTVSGTYTLATACPTITLTPATAGTLTAGVIGNTYSVNITSSRTGATFTATGLPAGLVLSSAGVISGTPTAVVTTTANVVVTATFGVCTGTATYTLLVGQNPTTAIDGTLSSQVKVYPNPSKADFNVDFASLNLGKVAIRVYDVQGKQVFTTSTSDNTTVISLEKFAKGMYLMEIESQKGRILKRIVKE